METASASVLKPPRKSPPRTGKTHASPLTGAGGTKVKKSAPKDVTSEPKISTIKYAVPQKHS